MVARQSDGAGAQPGRMVVISTLGLPQDVLKANIGAACEPLDPALYEPAMLSLPMAQRAVERLHGRSGVCPSRIAMLAGAGVARSDGARALAQVAERWSIPVATTLDAAPAK